MTAPYRPTLISPGSIGASTSASVTFVFTFNSFVAGATAYQYELRRRTTGVTVGSYEYWDGTTWQSTDQWNNVVGTVNDGEDVSVTVTAGWTNNTIYEWSARFRNSSLEEGEWARAHLLAIETAPSLTFSGDDPTANSRPVINWVFSGATGRRQAAYQLAVYDQTVSNDASFDPADATWQAQALWIMDDFKYSQNDYYFEPAVDLPTSASYDVYYRVEDDYGFRTEWAQGFAFDSTFTPPFIPDLRAEYQTGEGEMEVTIASAFNILDAESSNFDDGLGAWSATENCTVEVSSSDLLVEAIQDTYDQLGTNNALYSGMTGTSSTYATLSSTQTNNAGEARTTCGPLLDGSLAFNVQAGTVYSTTVNVTQTSATGDVQADLLWYDGAGAYLSTSAGTPVSCVLNTATDVENWDNTAPASAEYVAIQLIIDGSIGDQCRVHTATLVPASEANYSPGGATGIQFVLQRSDDGGNTWEFVWGASRDNPADIDDQYSQRSVLTDRAVRFTKALKYRAFARGVSNGDIQYSEPRTVDVSAVNDRYWWLRSITDSTKDMKIRAASLEEMYDDKKQSFYPVGGSEPIIISNDEPATRTVSITVNTLNESEFDSLLALIETSEEIFLQRNVGENLYIRPNSGIQKRRKTARSSGTGAPTRHFYEVSFSASVCGCPVT